MKRSTVDMRLRTLDGRYGVVLPARTVERMYALSARAYPMETGGILTGHYTSNLDTAIVNGVGRAPIDSRATYSTFERGELGVNRGLRMLWRRPCRRYYLGEWHFHPDTRTNLEPSGRDRAEMRRLASNPAVCCAEPLLVIVGGNPEQPWLLAAWVTAQQGRLVALMPETL